MCVLRLPSWTAQTQDIFINTVRHIRQSGKIKAQGMLGALLTPGVGGHRAVSETRLRNALGHL